MKLFGYSISLNIVILIGILYLIMIVNALSSSCNREGYDRRMTQQQNQGAYNSALRANNQAGMDEAIAYAKKKKYKLNVKR